MYDKIESIAALTEALHPRGVREAVLLANLKVGGWVCVCVFVCVCVCVCVCV